MCIYLCSRARQNLISLNDPLPWSRIYVQLKDVCATARPEPTQRYLPQPLRVPFVCRPHFASMRSRPGGAILRGIVTDLGRLGLAATATTLLNSIVQYFSLRFFFSSTSDEEFAPKKKKTELSPNCRMFFSHSIVHIRDRGVGSEDGTLPVMHVMLVIKKNMHSSATPPPSRRLPVYDRYHLPTVHSVCD